MHVQLMRVGCYGRFSDMTSSVSVISSKSSPLLTTHHASSSSRSRQSSPVGDTNNVVAWLKEIRLHKYAEHLAKYTWDEVYCQYYDYYCYTTNTLGLCLTILFSRDNFKLDWAPRSLKEPLGLLVQDFIQAGKGCPTSSVEVMNR